MPEGYCVKERKKVEIKDAAEANEANAKLARHIERPPASTALRGEPRAKTRDRRHVYRSGFGRDRSATGSGGLERQRGGEHDHSPSSLDLRPDHLPNQMWSVGLTSRATGLPLLSRAPAPTAITWPSCYFSLAVSGVIIPRLVFSSASIRLTTTRSCYGRNFINSSFLSS